jgi:hypothetical protein
MDDRTPVAHPTSMGYHSEPLFTFSEILTVLVIGVA